MYRFGDGTPFPLQDNFIDTLLAAIDACVGTFGAAAEIDDRREKTRNARKEAEEDLNRLGLLEKGFVLAAAPMKPSLDKGADPASLAAARALGAARASLGGARKLVEERLEILAGEPRSERALERMRTALATFFEHHQLPDTIWRWTWAATRERTSGEAIAASGRFRASFDLALDGPWTAVVRVGSIAPGLVATVMKKKLFGGEKRAKISLDRAGLVGVESSPERSILIVRAHAARPSPGWKIVLGETGVVMVTPLDLSGHAAGAELALEGDDAAPYARLWEAVECDLAEIVDDRRRMRGLEVGDHSIDTITEPAMVARALLGVLGPLVRQIRAKSRVPGELAIKRDVDDNRREELYVPRAEVERRFASLPNVYKKSFEEIGLGRQDTVEIISTDDAETIPEPPRPPTLGKLPSVPTTPAPQHAIARITLRAVPA